MGMTNFDNILWTWVTIFQCITTEGWTDIMYALQVSMLLLLGGWSATSNLLQHNPLSRYSLQPSCAAVDMHHAMSVHILIAMDL